MRVELRLNGAPKAVDVEPQELLLDVLRERLGLTGAKRSCDVQVCGTCTVLVDGQPVSSCTYLVAEAQGHEITTIEGFRGTDDFARIADAFTRRAASQCGFCTPAIVLTIHALLEEGAFTDEDAIRQGLAGNLCRCTGYRAILQAVGDLAGVETHGADHAPIAEPAS